MRPTFTQLCSSFASSASRCSAATAIHANASTISGFKVDTSTIILLRKVLRLLSIRGAVFLFQRFRTFCPITSVFSVHHCE